MENVAELTRVPVPLAQELVKSIRLLALMGKKLFRRYLAEPLFHAEGDRDFTAESSWKMMERIDRALADPASAHTAAPLCRRLIAQSLSESYSALGDCAIFFLERMMAHPELAESREAISFYNIAGPKLREFTLMHATQSNKLFEEGLKEMSEGDFAEAFTPVDLGRHKVRVELEQEAKILFEKIKTAHAREDLNRCRKLLSAYLVRYADQGDHNREQVEQLIDAFESRQPGFRDDLERSMAINLYFDIVGGITRSNLKQSIRGIRKYAHIFQGNPDIPHYEDIDNLERKLYSIIEEKNLWAKLKKA